MKTKFRGVTYRIVKKKRLKGKASAYANAPTDRKPKLTFDKVWFTKRNRKRVLEVLVHEALHACFWDLDEKAVRESGKDISRFLRKMNVRVG